MAEVAKEKFKSFDWSDERWQGYLRDLYPTPNHKAIVKFKKKWFKRTIDPELDLDWDPLAEAQDSSVGAGGQTGAPPPGAGGAGGVGRPPTTYGTGGGGVPLTKAAVNAAFLFHGLGVLFVMASIIGFVSSVQAVAALSVAYVLEVQGRYKFEFSKEWLQKVVLDECGQQLMVIPVVATIGTNVLCQVLAVTSPMLTSVLQAANLSKDPQCVFPSALKSRLHPMTEVQTRYQVLGLRADVEVGLGFILLFFVFVGQSSILSTLVYWNFMMMRYASSAFTQASFRKLDSVLGPFFARLPMLHRGYLWLKRTAYSQVDPTQVQQRSCTIM